MIANDLWNTKIKCCYKNLMTIIALDSRIVNPLMGIHFLTGHLSTNGPSNTQKSRIAQPPNVE